jgi:hypothetical protein
MGRAGGLPSGLLAVPLRCFATDQASVHAIDVHSALTSWLRTGTHEKVHVARKATPLV